MGAAEGLRPVPTGPYPAVLSVERQVSDQGLVDLRGNSYSIGPGRAATTVTVAHRLGTTTLDIITLRGVVAARHRRRLDSAGEVVRHDEHVAAMEATVWPRSPTGPRVGASCAARPHPPARAEADRLRAGGAPGPAEQVVIDFTRYAAAAADRQHPHPPRPARRHRDRPDERPDERPGEPAGRRLDVGR